MNQFLVVNIYWLDVIFSTIVLDFISIKLMTIVGYHGSWNSKHYHDVLPYELPNFSLHD